MDRLKISTRLYASIILFILLIACMTYNFVTSVYKNIEFANLELIGSNYERPLITVLSKISDYRILSALPSNFPERSQKISKKIEEINTNFQKLQSLNSKYINELRLDKELMKSKGLEHINIDEIQAKWQALSSSSDSAAIVEKSQEIIADLKALAGYVGITSNVVLDPELDSYSLGDVAVGVAPSLFDHLDDIGSKVIELLIKNKPLEEKDKLELYSAMELLKQSDATRILGDIDTAIDANRDANNGKTELKNEMSVQYDSFNKSVFTDIESLVSEIIKAPVGTVKLEETFAKYEKAASDTYSIFEISINEFDVLLKARIERNKSHVANVLMFSLVGFLGALFFFHLVIRSIKNPLQDIQAAMGIIADGNLKHEVPHVEKRDEIGAMAQSLQIFKENSITAKNLEEEQKRLEIKAQEDKKIAMKKLASDFQSRVQGIIETVASASTELYHTAEDMNKVVRNVSEKSANAAVVSGQTSGNVASISAAVEEMSASVREIASQISKSTALISETVSQTQQADKTTKDLSDSVKQISSILSIIENIAEQINLLALNATIESARAGDAGKGFAVVASEVKHLANQTTKATEEIAKQIENVQNASDQVIGVLKGINGSISNVSNYSTGIASAVEEQSAATQEISSNMNHTSNGVRDISQGISSISKDAENANNSAQEVLKASRMLSEQSELLNNQVKIFINSLVE